MHVDVEVEAVIPFPCEEVAAVDDLVVVGETVAEEPCLEVICDPSATGGAVRQLTEWMLAYHSGAFTGSPA